MNLEYYEGRKFAVVFVKVVDEATSKVQLRTIHGRADVDRGALSVVAPEGGRFAVPHSALRNILPNDGTDILRDCEYYALVKVDSGIELETPDYME